MPTATPPHLPAQEQLPALSGDILAALILVGALAMLVVGYLWFDYLKTRRETRKLEFKRRLARENWQQHQSNAR